ncbi:MAG: hypothetical protein ACLQU4_05470 [Limisphaerales bacterium]
MNAMDETEHADGAFGTARLLLLLGLLMCASFPGIVFGSDAFVYRDDGLFGYPVAYYARHCFWHGHVPLWNPYNNCGIPFLAQWNTMALYPLSLLYLVPPMPWSMNYFLLGHIFLAGAGMCLLARRWFGNPFAATLAGLVFAWNGLSINLLIWPCHIAALAWMPWVVLLCEKAALQGGRAVFWAALAGACQMMTGSPEMILFTWLIALAVCAAQWPGNRRDALGMALRFAAVAGWVAALSAAQLAPWLDFVAHGDRNSAFDKGHWALPVWGIGNFLVPLFRDNASVEGVFWQPGQEMFSSYYAGIVTVALVVIALMKARDRRTILLAVLALGGLLCAWGGAGHVLPLLKKTLPWLGFARYPVKFLIITLFCLPLLAARGVAWLQSHADAASRQALLTAGGITGVCIVCVLIVSRRFPVFGEDWSVTWRSGWTRLAILLTALVILLPQRPGAVRSGRLLAGFGLLVLMGLDICTHEPRQNPTAAAQAYDDVTPPMSSVPVLGRSRAMVSPKMDAWLEHLANPSELGLYLSLRTELFKDCNLLSLIPKVDGFFSLYLRRQDDVARLLAAHDDLPNLTEFLGVSQRASATNLFAWEAQPRFMPMATIGQKPVFLDDASTLATLASPDFRPREVVYLPIEARDSVSATADAAAKILSSRVTAAECEFETEASRPTMLVVAQTWYHCWVAEIDGHAAPLLRANYDFQSLSVPAGRHQVRLAYKDSLFHVGAIISLLSLALGALGAFRRGKL